MKKYIYFSGTDTTKRIMHILGADDRNSINITAGKPDGGALTFGADDLVFVGFPIYGGRVPQVVLDRLATLNGGRCMLVVVGVYGNRHYDDALKEMQAFAEKHGCRVVAAIAAVAEHNMVRTVATGRPDAADVKRLQEIKAEIDTKYAAGELSSMPHQPVEAYKEFNPLPIHPIATDDCSSCGICAEECPMKAISRDDPRQIDDSLCINCMRCTNVCPSAARQLPEEMQAMLKARLEPICTERRESEIFL